MTEISKSDILAKARILTRREWNRAVDLARADYKGDGSDSLCGAGLAGSRKFKEWDNPDKTILRTKELRDRDLGLVAAAELLLTKV